MGPQGIGEAGCGLARLPHGTDEGPVRQVLVEDEVVSTYTEGGEVLVAQFGEIGTLGTDVRPVDGQRVLDGTDEEVPGDLDSTLLEEDLEAPLLAAAHPIEDGGNGADHPGGVLHLQRSHVLDAESEQGAGPGRYQQRWTEHGDQEVATVDG